MISAKSIAKLFVSNEGERKILERKIITFAQRFNSIKREHNYILYAETIQPNCQLLLNVSNEYNELITVLRTEGDLVYFSLNGIENKKDIIHFEPIDLTIEIMLTLGFVEKKHLGWFTQKETGFPVVYETHEKQTTKWNTDKENEIITETIYDFYKIVDFENKKYKLKINWLHELQMLYFNEIKQTMLLNNLPVKYESMWSLLGIKSGRR